MSDPVIIQVAMNFQAQSCDEPKKFLNVALGLVKNNFR